MIAKVRERFAVGKQAAQRFDGQRFNLRKLNELERCIGSWWGNWREGDHWGDLGVDGWIILGWISRRWEVGIWTGLGWPRIETGGGRL